MIDTTAAIALVLAEPTIGAKIDALARLLATLRQCRNTTSRSFSFTVGLAVVFVLFGAIVLWPL
jgi:hypothetical protein